MRELLTYVARRAKHPDAKPPPKLRRQAFSNFNDVYRDGAIELARVLAAGHTFYVNGFDSDDVREALLEGGNPEVVPLLAWLQELMQKAPLKADLWASGGGSTARGQCRPPCL